MPGPFREKILLVLVKPETTTGVDSVPTGTAIAIRVVGIPTLEYDFMESGDRDDAQTGLLSGPDRAAPAGVFGRIPLTVEVAGAAAVYSGAVKPPADPLLRIAGMGVTTDFTGSAEFYRYATLDVGMETGTLYLYSANKLFKMVGAVATLRGNADVYKRGQLQFTVSGKITSITEVGLPTFSFPQIIPPLFHSAAAAIGSWTTASAEPLMLTSAAFDLGNVVADISGAGATDGLVSWIITDRNVTQDFTYNVPALATFDPFAASGANGLGGVTTAWQVGSQQYNRMKVETRWAARPPRQASRNGIVQYQQSGICRVNAGLTSGREIQLTFN
jgi:hypothetical protein